MKRFTTWSAIVATLALLIAPPAFADNYPVKDSSGTTQTFCSKLVGGLQHPCHLLEGLFSGTPTPISVDASGNINVNAVSSVLPTGATTAANQTSIITQETAINTDIGTISDSTWAGSGSGSLTSIQKYMAAKLEAIRAQLVGTTAVSGSVSLTGTLPAFAATPTFNCGTGCGGGGAAGNIFYTGTTTPLTATSTYTGSTRDTGVAAGTAEPYAYFNAFFLADQIGTAFVDGSNDGSTWFVAATSSLSISTPLALTVPVMFRYHRARFVNGATNQGSFVVNSSYSAS
jgi:hypothetical protein